MKNWTSIFFAVSKELEYFQEKPDDVDVEDNGSHNVVVEGQLFLLASQNQLSIHKNVNAVDAGNRESHNVDKERTSEDEDIKHCQEKENPENAAGKC